MFHESIERVYRQYVWTAVLLVMDKPSNSEEGSGCRLNLFIARSYYNKNEPKIKTNIDKLYLSFM